MWKTPETPQGAVACELPAREILPRRTIYAALLFLCLLSYRGVFDNGLFNDDFSWLRAARHEMHPGNLLSYRVVDFFRPLVNLSFWAMEKAAPGNLPLQYAFNLLLHVLCSILVYHIARKIAGGIWIAAAAATLFAVTSVHAAAVLWISARTTLLSSVFLLAAIDAVLVEGRPGAGRVAAGGVLYALALASKEEAIAGLPNAVALLFVTRRDDRRPRVGGAAVVAFAAVSAAYLLLRSAFMGGFAGDNYGAGAHVLRNAAGGFLYQLYPWPLFSLFHPAGTAIPEPADAIMPEILALPAIALLWLAGFAGGHRREMNASLLWGILALAPVAPFRYRFFSTVSFSQSRYYYLSSVGTALAVVLALSLVWRPRERWRQVLTVVLFALLAAGYVVRDHRLEAKWDEFTRYYEGIVVAIVEEGSRYPDASTVAVANPPMAFKYLADALALERPGWRAVEAADRADAERHAPCLFVSYSGERPKVMRMERIGPAQ